MTEVVRSRLNLRDKALLKAEAYVGGRWTMGDTSGRSTVVDPSDGRIVAEVPSLTLAEIQRCIDQAYALQRSWGASLVKTRSAILRKWYELVLENADDLAAILCMEQGKPLSEAKAEVVANAGFLDWYAEEAKRINGDVIPGARADQRILVMKQPVGVCAAITPWNFPNGMVTRKVGAALAAGCTVILKPAPQTPLSALALAVLAERAGVPAGVFSVVTGDAPMIGAEICKNPKIAKISFTGSTAVGRWLMREAADSIKRLSFELGGNAAFIVFDDADLDSAVEGAIASKFRNAGQTCVCANRIYVQSGIAGEFTKRFLDRVAGIRLGPGSDPATTQGPLIDHRAVEKVEAHIADAVGKGASVACGGKRSALGGTFFEPTVITGVKPGMRVLKEETFAPLAPLISFDREEDVIAMANDTEYGLVGFFYSRDLSRVWRVAEALETGMVGVNTGLIANEMAPFGGIKQSGFGREGSTRGLDDFLNLKYLSLNGI
ncbi:MAG: NAD-dependent succinate-semialdehyde dehydrogenase [Rhizobiaceae bacterium]|nr:NAD-dependent succinate-semialdehyde dehydrogenase [Rhizobiaceae bacterium]